MLEIVRKSARGTTGKIIVGVIVVAFTLGGAFSIVNITNNSSPVEVNGEGISDVKVQRMVRARQQQLMQQLGENASPDLLNSPFIRQSAINNLISQELQAQASDALGLAISSEQLSQDIARIGAFQVDGQFDQETFRRVIAQNGYTPTTFRTEQTTQLKLNQLRNGVVSSAFTVTPEAERVAQLSNQTREISYRQFQAEDFVDEVSVSDESIQNYYDANSSQFLSDEQVKVRFLRLSRTDLMPDMVVNESEIEAAYESYVNEQEANAVREVSHILFANGDDPQSEAEAARQRLQEGASFADLARELSDDPGSAESGGSLGRLEEGLYVDAFYEAGKALTQVGDVSEPVETQFGYHLIKLDSFSSAEVKSMAEMRDELEQQVRAEKAEEELGLVESQLADQAFQADQIESVAGSFGTTVEITDWITQNDAPQSESDPTTDPAFISTAFSEVVVDEGLISDVVELSNGDLVVMQLEDYQPEEVQSLETVRADIEQVLVTQQSRDLAEQAAQDAVEQVNQNQALPDESQWREPVSTGRDGSELPGNLTQFSFTMPKPESSGISAAVHSTDQAAFAVALLSVQSGEATSENVAALESQLSQRKGQAEYQSFFSMLRQTADIEVQGQARTNQNQSM